jgi:N-acetylglucosaminyldiphosphoundecaprenol N-acetyl-beta-D-mannosaminyltransferase
MSVEELMMSQPPQATVPQRANVLGVGISIINLDSAVSCVGAALERKNKGYVCITGVHGVSEAQKDASFRAILNRSFLNTPDGMPMVWMGRLQGFNQIGRVYGPDLMLRVCELTRSGEYTHFLYGGGPGVAEELKSRLERRFSGLRIVGTHSPPFRQPTDAEVNDLVRQVGELRPDIIWVGLSTPKQEKFMAENWQRLDATLFFGVGAAFDFHAGRVRQAPRIMQRSGLEWLFRLGCEPRRLWKRYLKNNPVFLFRAVCQLAHLRQYDLEQR